MERSVNLLVVYKAHGHPSLASRFSGPSSTHGFVTDGFQSKHHSGYGTGRSEIELQLGPSNSKGTTFGGAMYRLDYNDLAFMMPNH